MKSYAFAKLNLALKIQGQRPDGYHALDMLMQQISLCDELTIHKAEALTVTADTALPEENTMTKAAQVFFAYTGLAGGADIAVKKNIPAQAGLGGGSSDGAAVLLALNKLYGTALRVEELIALGQTVGADVPFFIRGGCARAQGTGEILTPLTNNLGGYYVLAKPACGVSTKEAYEGYHHYGGMPVDMEAAVLAIESGDAGLLAARGGNDLMPAALAICPEIGRALEEMRDAEIALMTGSGSCVFGLYGDKKAAAEKCERLLQLDEFDFVYIAENR